ncbi:MAG: hypothetical protein HY904_05540 [Deltaproteobacteria bacterium]|nr:hypothetical protein [Deltaproteobacteria bacterium]
MAASIARFEDLCRAREFAALLCRLGRFDLQWKTVHGNSETLCHHELDKPFVERRRLQMGRGPVTVPSDLCGVFIPDPEGGLLVVRRHPTGEMAVSLGVGMGAGVLAAVAGPPWPEAGVALVGLSALLAANSAMLLMRTLNQPQYRIHRGGVSACSPHMTGLWHLPARSIESVFVEGNCIQLIGDGWVRTLPIGVFAGAGRIMPLVAAALCGQQFEPGP